MKNIFRPLLAVTIGDPGGIGPEICVKALNLLEIYDICRPLVIGDIGVVRNAIGFCSLSLEARSVASPEDGVYQLGTIDVMDLANLPLNRLRHNEVTVLQGKASFEYIDRAIQLAMNKQVDGTVTGPISKAALNAAGFHYAGHTEIYAEKTGSRDYAMMLADGNFRVVHVSTHVSLREACDRVRRDRVLKVIRLANDAVVRVSGKTPKVAVAGLNPHAGEDCLFGREDHDEILPAVEDAQRQGIDAEGPLPADTVFSKMKGGQYDAVVVMYHDQGHIPMKVLGFNLDPKSGEWKSMAGVNVTLGLPIIRTSVDHGTAFDKGGEGRANPQSLVQAVKIATQLAS